METTEPDHNMTPLQFARAYDPEACMSLDGTRALLVNARAAEALLNCYPSAREDAPLAFGDFKRVIVGDIS